MTKPKTDAEAQTERDREEEEGALDALEENQLAVERKARRDALRPHAKEEVARRRVADANKDDDDDNGV